MRIDGPFLIAFRLLARVVGVVWILGGVLFLVSSGMVGELHLVYAGIGVLLLVAGVGLVFAKPPTRENLEQLRGFARKD